MAAQTKPSDLARGAFERFTGRPFPKATRAQLPWLGCFTLDGYNADLRIAFMYNGKHHYEYVEQYHKSGQADFVRQLETDARKNFLCAAHGVILITIPYTIPVAGYTGYVVNALDHIQTAADAEDADEDPGADGECTTDEPGAPQNTTECQNPFSDVAGGLERLRITNAKRPRKHVWNTYNPVSQ